MTVGGTCPVQVSRDVTGHKSLITHQYGISHGADINGMENAPTLPAFVTVLTFHTS